MKHMAYWRRILVGCLLMASGTLKAQEWESADDTTQTERARIRKSDYEVKVRSGRGEWRTAWTVGALVSNIDLRGNDGDRGINGTDTLGRARTRMGVAMFSESEDGGKAYEVEVRRLGAPFREVKIRPTAYGVKPKRIDGQTLRFRLPRPMRVSVEFDGDRDHNLFVFADRPIEKPAGSDNLIYYGPGEHEAGLITLHSGQTLFIDEGAIVYGHIEARNAEHVRIAGHGIVCGSCNTHDFQHRKSLLFMKNCRDIEVEGIFFRGSPSWSLCFSECEGLRMRDVKEVCWMRNSDGIDLCNTRNVRIEDCFLRNYDDNISLKNYPARSGISTSNVRMTGCTLWADCAHNIVVGPESVETLPMENVEFDGIEILEARETAWPWRGAFAVMGSDDGTFRNVVFRDICIDHTRGGQMFAVELCPYRTMGRAVQNVSIENVRFLGDTTQLPPSTIKGLDADHPIDGIGLHNLRINGRRLTPRTLPQRVETNDFIRRLRVNKKTQ